MQQSWRGRPSSPVRAGQTLRGRASWAWPLDINMALCGSPDHGHPHGPQTSTQIPGYHGATSEASLGSRWQCRLLSPAWSSPQQRLQSHLSPQHMDRSVSLLSHFSTTFAHRSGTRWWSPYSHRVCSDTSQLPCLSAMQRWNLHFLHSFKFEGER